MNANWHPRSHYSRDKFGVDAVVLAALLLGIAVALAAAWLTP